MSHNDKALNLLIRSMQLWGLFPPALSSLCRVRHNHHHHHHHHHNQIYHHRNSSSTEPPREAPATLSTWANSNNRSLKQAGRRASRISRSSQSSSQQQHGGNNCGNSPDCAWSLLCIIYSAIMVLLSWMNAFRYLTLYALTPITLVTDYTYLTSICLYYFVGAILRTSIVVSCWMGGNEWRRLIDRIGESDYSLATALQDVQEKLFRLRNRMKPVGVTEETGRRRRSNSSCSTDCSSDPGKMMRTRVWLLTYVITAWATLALGVASLTALMLLYREQFGIFATPFHAHDGAFTDYSLWLLDSWPVIVAICGTLLQSINDSGVFFVSAFISCITLVQAGQFGELRKLVLQMCPGAADDDDDALGTRHVGISPPLPYTTVNYDTADEETTSGFQDEPAILVRGNRRGVIPNHVNYFNSDEPETDSLNDSGRLNNIANISPRILSNNKPIPRIVVPPPPPPPTQPQQQPEKVFDLALIRQLHLRLKMTVQKTDRLSRIVICVSMLHGFFGMLILSHHIILGSVTLFGRLTWAVWLLASFNLLFVHATSSAYLHHESASVVGALHRVSGKMLPTDLAGVTELMVLLNQISSEPVALTLLGLLPLRRQTTIAFLGALCTYFIILIDYSTAELHRLVKSNADGSKSSEQLAVDANSQDIMRLFLTGSGNNNKGKINPNVLHLVTAKNPPPD